MCLSSQNILKFNFSFYKKNQYVFRFFIKKNCSIKSSSSVTKNACYVKMEGVKIYWIFIETKIKFSKDFE